MVSANENLLESGHLLALQFKPIKTTSHYKKKIMLQNYFFKPFSPLYFFLSSPTLV
jgi:hypothetical protein